MPGTPAGRGGVEPHVNEATLAADDLLPEDAGRDECLQAARSRLSTGKPRVQKGCRFGSDLPPSAIPVFKLGIHPLTLPPTWYQPSC